MWPPKLARRVTLIVSWWLVIRHNDHDFFFCENQQAVRPHEDLTIVNDMDMSPVRQVWAKPSCKAQWKGERWQSRHKKRWNDNTREWKGLEFDKPQRAVENQDKMKKLLIKSSVVPKRPSRLIWERWGERECDYDFELSWALHIKNQSQSIWLSYFFTVGDLCCKLQNGRLCPELYNRKKSIVLVHQCNWSRRHADKNHQTVKENFHHEYNY